MMMYERHKQKIDGKVPAFPIFTSRIYPFKKTRNHYDESGTDPLFSSK